jgi:hypothetical protein
MRQMATRAPRRVIRGGRVLGAAAMLLGLACARPMPSVAPSAVNAADPAVAAALGYLQALSDDDLAGARALAAADQQGDTAQAKAQVVSLQLKGCGQSRLEPTAHTRDTATDAVVSVRLVPPCGHRTVIRASEVDTPLSGCRLGVRLEAGAWRPLPLTLQCPAE